MQDHHHDITTLLLGGFLGSLVRLVLNPERCWYRWVVQIFIGLSTAVCLGWFISEYMELPNSGYVAIGFLIGTCAEGAISLAQRKLGLRAEKNHSDATALQKPTDPTEQP